MFFLKFWPYVQLVVFKSGTTVSGLGYDDMRTVVMFLPVIQWIGEFLHNLVQSIFLFNYILDPNWHEL